MTLWQLPPGIERGETADTTSYVVFVLDSDGELEAIRSDLAGRGVNVDAFVRSSANNRFFQFYDPDGNRWEIAQPISEAFRETAQELAHRG